MPSRNRIRNRNQAQLSQAAQSCSSLSQFLINPSNSVTSRGDEEAERVGSNGGDTHENDAGLLDDQLDEDVPYEYDDDSDDQLEVSATADDVDAEVDEAGATHTTAVVKPPIGPPGNLNHTYYFLHHSFPTVLIYVLLQFNYAKHIEFNNHY